MDKTLGAEIRREGDLSSRAGQMTRLYGLADQADALTAETEVMRKDFERMEWLETQREAYGFQQEHLGNRWVLDGPFNSARDAIDFAMKGEG